MSKVYKKAKQIVKAAFNVVKSVVRAVVNVVSGVIKFATQAFMGLLGGAPDLSNNVAATQQAQGIQLQRSGSINSVPVVYGYRKVGAITPYIETGSTNNKYLWVSYIFSEGPIEGLYKLYLNDIDVDTGNTGTSAIAKLNNGETVDITWGKFAGRVKMRFFPGVYHTDPESSTVGDIVLADVFNGAPSFTRSMVYNGLATLFVRFEYFTIVTQADADANPWDGSVPRMTAEILGRKIQRLYTNTGNTTIPTFTKITSTETNSSYSPGNESYSTNPAEILLDYLRNTRYGKGLANTEIDWPSWYATANKCNQYVDFTSTTRGSILQLHPVIETEQSIFNNVKVLLQQFRAYMPYTQGTYKLKIEDAGHPTDITSGSANISATFNPDSIVGSVSYTGIDRGSKYNQVIVTYVDPTTTGKFTNQTVVYPETEAERQVYIAQDGGREYKLEITMPAITNYAIAKDMARLMFNKSRYQETCTVTVTSQAIELELGDNIYIQSKILNFSTTPWRVVSIKYNEDYSFELGCVRNPDFIYPYVTVGEADVVSATYLPKGAQIYYPPNVDTTPHIGLRPPNKVRLPSGGTSDNPVTNPDPSNNPDETNNTPTAPPGLPSLVDTVTFTGTPTVNSVGGQIYARIPFNIPQTPFYAGVTVAYYLANSIDESVTTTTYGFTNVSGGLLGELTTFDHTILPGAGGSTSIVIGPLDSTLYEVRLRVYYTDGQYSTLDQLLVLDPSASSTDTTISALPKVISDIVDTSSIRAVGMPKYSLSESTRTLWKDGEFGQSAYTATSGAWVNYPMVGDVSWIHLYLYNNYPAETANRVVGVNVYHKRPGQTVYNKHTAIDPNWLGSSLPAGNYPNYYDWPNRVVLYDFNTGNPKTSKALSALFSLRSVNYGVPSLATNFPDDTAIDIIIRLVYKNGSESAYQNKFTFTYPGQFTNDFFGAFNNGILFDAFRGIRVSGDTNAPIANWTTNKWAEKTPSWLDTTTTVHTSPPARLSLYSGGPAAGLFSNFSKLNIRMAVEGVYDGGSEDTPSITIKLYPPNTSTSGNGILGGTGSDRSYWRGQKISYRPVRPGFTVPFTTVTDKNITVGTSGWVGIKLSTGIFYDQLYEIVITPQIVDASQSGYTATNTTTAQDANYSLFGVGFVNNIDGEGYPTNGNWNWVFNWKTVRTSYALQSYDSNLPIGLYYWPSGVDRLEASSLQYFPQIVKFNTRCVNKDITRAIGTPNAKDTGTGYEINFYHQVQLYVGHIPNYSKLHVYRRHNADEPRVEASTGGGILGSIVPNIFSSLTRGIYYGMGRWERVLVTTSPTSGNINLNLRGPTHYKTFAKSSTLGTIAAIAANVAISSNVTLANGTTQIVSAEEEGQEFLFIAEQTGNVFSTVGSFITTQRATGGVDTNQLSPTRYQVLSYGYAAPDGGGGVLDKVSVFQNVEYQGQFIGRNLNEARTTTLTANLVGFSDTIPYSTTGNIAGITKFITYPTTDFGANISPAIV